MYYVGDKRRFYKKGGGWLCEGWGVWWEILVLLFIEVWDVMPPYGIRVLQSFYGLTFDLQPLCQCQIGAATSNRPITLLLWGVK